MWPAPDILRHMAGVALLLACTGCAALRVERFGVEGCDPSWLGMGSEYVARNFNLHRGRWWDYYGRGQCYLALGLYGDAVTDFNSAIDKRGRDTWDARTYGMHFLDYFPHRERGIALYFQSREADSVDQRQDLLGRAIDDLETSHRQQESSRADFYLNRALQAYWHGRDASPPVVAVVTPIYTNRAPVRVRVEALDRESGVAEIRVTRLDGGLITEHSFELAEKTQSKEIEVPLDPLAESTDVRVVAVDVVGNASVPRTLRIVMDTTAPTASIEFEEDPGRGKGRISARILAADAGGLARITVGEANDTYECLGEPNCVRIVHGTKGEELALRIVDRAGNETLSSVRLGEASPGIQPWRPTRPLSGYLLQDDGREGIWGPVRTTAFPDAEARPSHRAGEAPGVWPLAYRHVSLDLIPGQMTSGSAITRPTPYFRFPLHVRPLSGPKETSHSVFYVEGTLYEAGDVTKITIDGKEVRGLAQQGATRIFSDKVDLRDLPAGKSRKIVVEAFRSGGPSGPEYSCCKEILEVNRVADPTSAPDMRYGIVVLPFQFWTPVRCQSAQDDSFARRIHDEVVGALGALQMSGSQQGERFTIQDDARVIAPNSSNLGDILRQVREWNRECLGDVNSIDLVICGELVRDCESDGERLEIRLKAIDVSRMEYVLFPSAEGDVATRFLADVYGYGSVEKRAWYIELLAAKVGQRIPRLEAEVQVPGRGGTACPRLATVSCGWSHGVFSHMKLCVYEKRDRGMKNGSLGRRICRAEIRKPGWTTSAVTLLPLSHDRLDCRGIVPGDITAIAK